MSFIDRIRRLSELGREKDFPFKLSRSLEINAISLENVAAYKEMVSTEGWAMLEYFLEKSIKRSQEEIVSLSSDPCKNKDEIIISYAIQEVSKRWLSHVRGVLTKEKLLVEEQSRLRDNVANI